MKIKPLYLYGGLSLLAIIFLIIFTQEKKQSDNVVQGNMPDDEIHKNLDNPVQAPPGKENVAEEIVHKMEVLKKEVEQNPQDTVKIKEYADLLAAGHRSDEAIIWYYNILNINPRRTDILNKLAFIYYSKKNYSKAADLINKVLLYEPDNTEAMYNLGAIAATSGNREEAKKRWKELIEKYPGSDESKLAENSLKQL